MLLVFAIVLLRLWEHLSGFRKCLPEPSETRSSFKSVGFELGTELAEHGKHRSVFGEHLRRFENVLLEIENVP
ncbi:MAG TPA: hypothetical protein VGG39_28290 [Polyangiaceae bacterium]